MKTKAVFLFLKFTAFPKSKFENKISIIVCWLIIQSVPGQSDRPLVLYEYNPLMYRMVVPNSVGIHE